MKKYLMTMIVLAMAACNEEEQTEIVVSKNYVAIVESMLLKGEGEQMELTLEANCPWTITGGEEWLEVNPTSGYSSQPITLKAERDFSGADRKALLVIQAQGIPQKKLTVSQPDISKEPSANDNTPPQ